jgi:DNA mismatch endonuclease (patch repair protein)
VTVFVDGCFWHQHRCHPRFTPKSRADFWETKFQRNVARDRLVTRTLRGAGWKVVRIWQCELTAKKEPRVLRRLRLALKASVTCTRTPQC